MKNFNSFPDPNKNELPPLEKYCNGHSLFLQKIIEDNPELEYLQYDNELLLAKGSDFPIIDESGNAGKSIFSGILKQDDLKGKNQELADKTKKMFDDFEIIDPDVQVGKFPKEQDYEKIRVGQNTGKEMDKNMVKAQTIYANTKLMEKERYLTHDEADEIIRYNLEKLLSKKSVLWK
jgi:hypothetical protein